MPCFLFTANLLQHALCSPRERLALWHLARQPLATLLTATSWRRSHAVDSGLGKCPEQTSGLLAVPWETSLGRMPSLEVPSRESPRANSVLPQWLDLFCLLFSVVASEATTAHHI